MKDLTPSFACSLLSICVYYIFNRIFSIESIIQFVGFNVTNIFNISSYFDLTLYEYKERLGIMIIFSSMYILFFSVYELFVRNNNFIRKYTNYSEAMYIRKKGIFIVFILFLFKIFQVVMWFLITLSIGGNKSILEMPLIFIATVVGSFILSEALLSSAIAFIFLSKLIILRGRA